VTSINEKIDELDEEQIKSFNRIKEQLMHDSKLCEDYHINPNDSNQLKIVAYNFLFRGTPSNY